MKKVIRIGICCVVMVALVLGYYYYISTKNDNSMNTSKDELSEVQAIIDKDFTSSYPASPRAVVKWYNRIISAYYSQEYSQEEFEAMADQARLLLDNELLELNPKEQYVNNLSAEIADYKNRSKIIASSNVCNTAEVEYKTVKGDKCAFVSAYYFIREGSSYTRTYEDYCLRKDADGHWKILTWRLSPGDFTNEF